MLSLLLLFSSTLAQSCLNDKGAAVDWWVILKLPHDTTIPYEGYEYYYCDSSNDCASMTFMSDILGDTTTPLQRTVSQIKFSSTTTMSVVWNDQPYGKSTISDRAHSKGILSAGLNGQGFIINHSTPQFPMFDNNQDEIISGMPSNSATYGQHFFCGTFATSEIEKVASEYIIAQTITQRANTPSGFSSSHPNLYALKDNSRTIPSQNGVVTIKTKAGLSIIVVSKNQNLVEDFYAALVAPNLKVGLVVETWGSGTGGLQDAECSNTYHTLSNLYRNHNGYKFKYTKDHSKFGVSLQSSLPYVCMSDINRMTTQQKRGGTTFCFLHSKLWTLIDKSFVERQSC